MANYREKWFQNNPSMFGKYRCQECGEWYPKSQIDIDHIIPQSKGGSDDLWNLRATCKHCNRSKQDSLNGVGGDLLQNAVQNIAKNAIKNFFK
jgi:5-methylcytosine-specific restriction endonuclease McrA